MANVIPTNMVDKIHIRKLASPLGILAFILALHIPLAAQAPSAKPQSPAPKPSSSDTVIQTGTQLVVVDVVVEDKDGHSIHGLKASNFTLSEDKTTVSLHSFEEHTPAITPTVLPPAPKLPAGTFTNYTPIPPNGTLNILLLDSLNTPMKDQSYVRSQLADYIKHAPAGTHIAIFGLNTRLFLLQGFTSDPEILKSVINKKLLPRSSNVLDDSSGSGITSESLSDSASDAGAPAQVVANFTQFEAQTAAFQTEFRIQYTLDAFNTLGHYLSAFPGRKNLIWFSGSFPINILPDPSTATPPPTAGTVQPVTDPFVTQTMNESQFRETMILLTRAQVAVYPIDARGLMTQPTFDASNSGGQYVRNPSRVGQDIAKFSLAQAQEHDTMQQLADNTGGHAFYNTNGITAAISKAIQAGSSYYTLTYTPPVRKYDGSYRKIHVALTDAPSNLKLAYRRGYFADDPQHPRKNDIAAPVSSAPTSAPGTRRNSDYIRASMSRGAPAPEDILFKVRVLPASAATEPTPAPGNELDPRAPLKGPFQRLAIDVASIPSEVTFLSNPDGTRDGILEYVAYLYDSDGKLLNRDVSAVQMHLTPENYNRFLRSALQVHLDMSVPLHQATYLRIGLHDGVSNHMGVVEIPVDSVSHLPPLPQQPSTPSTPQPSSPTTSTPSTTLASPTPSTPH
jgi:VWFA-related protein